MNAIGKHKHTAAAAECGRIHFGSSGTHTSPVHMPSARARVLPMDAHSNYRPRPVKTARKNMDGGGKGEARIGWRRVVFDGALEDLQRETALNKANAKGSCAGCRYISWDIPVPHGDPLCSACIGKGQAGKGNDYAPYAHMTPWRYTTTLLPLPGFPPNSNGRVWRAGILGNRARTRAVRLAVAGI